MGFIRLEKNVLIGWNSDLYACGKAPEKYIEHCQQKCNIYANVAYFRFTLIVAHVKLFNLAKRRGSLTHIKELMKICITVLERKNLT